MTPANTDLTATTQAFARQHGLTGAPQQVLPLQQSWLDEPEPDFRPATAALYPRKDGLHVVVALSDEDIFNSADGFNQKTWRMGDVAECFIAVTGSPIYWELHFTPGNQRLQLEWTLETFLRFRAKEGVFEQHLVNDPSFCSSSVSVDQEDKLWQVYFVIPWTSIGLSAGADAYRIDFAVCRYDVSRQSDGITYASTAKLPVADYHLRDHWHKLTLRPD